MTGLLLLSACGTSLLTNPAGPEDLRWLTEIANKPRLDAGEERRLTNLVKEGADSLVEADDRARRRLSAELNGIAAVLGRFRGERVYHILIHTDTAVGRAAARLVADHLESRGEICELLSAQGLRTDHPASFREALADLTKQLEDRIPGYRSSGYFVVFNLTGGFKSVNAYLQALAMIYADRSVFLFESAAELMEVPRLPVQLVEAGVVKAHLLVFRKLSAGYSVSSADAQGVPESLLLEVEGEVSTSVWGEVVWARVRKDLLAESLCDALSPKLILSDTLRRAFEKLEPKRKVQVNEALDELSSFIDRVRPQLRSRTFKKLAGNPVTGSTHELYLWSDGGAARLFGHFEGEKFIADRMSEHHL